MILSLTILNDESNINFEKSVFHCFVFTNQSGNYISGCSLRYSAGKPGSMYLLIFYSPIIYQCSI